MSFKDSTCDYCGRGHLLDTGDERSIVNPGQTLWCGTCREGSRKRFEAFTDSVLWSMRDGCQRNLERDPIRWDDKENPETLEERAGKIYLLDEKWRIEQELSYRAKEATS